MSSSIEHTLEEQVRDIIVDSYSELSGLEPREVHAALEELRVKRDGSVTKEIARYRKQCERLLRLSNLESLEQQELHMEIEDDCERLPEMHRYPQLFAIEDEAFLKAKTIQELVEIVLTELNRAIEEIEQK